jgi:hypothetical protein
LIDSTVFNFCLLGQPLGNQELWKFVHSVYGEELGFSSNDEVDEVPAIGIGTPSSDHQNPGHPHIPSSPSPSLHSAQTSNDDNDSVQQLKLNRVHLHEVCPTFVAPAMCREGRCTQSHLSAGKLAVKISVKMKQRILWSEKKTKQVFPKVNQKRV